MKLLIMEHPDYECGHDIEVVEDIVSMEEFKKAVEGMKKTKELCEDKGYKVYLCTVDSFYSD